MKFKITFLICAFFLCGALWWGQNSGTAGPLTWSLDAGVLTISGSGEMDYYDDSTTPGLNAPWYPHKSIITSVVIESGVTRIGHQAFYGYTSLLSVTIGDDVASIGNGAFRNSTNLALIEVKATTPPNSGKC